ncbi:MAG: MarR family winged helix-turn-helix transcriptional regulator [Actinobacteria bacterium]|nr:MarR family winged helix-turn-helix transcriptional regulator [Actinomycetota bacterium]
MNYLTADELDLCAQVRAACACNQLRRAMRGVTELYEDALAASRLKATQLPILVCLASAGDVSVSVLADALSLDRTTLTRNVQVLEERGLVRTSESEDDRRVRIVSLTLEGSRVLSGALVGWEQMHAVVEKRFGRERLSALYDELAALGDAIG